MRHEEERRRAHEEAQRRNARPRTARGYPRRTEEERRQQRKEEIRSAWFLYEEGLPLYGALSFTTIMWPVVDRPQDPSSLTREAIEEFLLSDVHSQGVSSRERIREALRRWHTDKCSAMFKRVTQSDKEVVREAVHVVTTHLNEMNTAL